MANQVISFTPYVNYGSANIYVSSGAQNFPWPGTENDVVGYTPSGGANDQLIGVFSGGTRYAAAQYSLLGGQSWWNIGLVDTAGWGNVPGRQVRGVQVKAYFGYLGDDSHDLGATAPSNFNSFYFFLGIQNPLSGSFDTVYTTGIDSVSYTAITDSNTTPPVGSTAGWTGNVWTSFTTVGGGSGYSPTVADIENLTISWQAYVPPGTPSPEIDFKSVQAFVYYNDPATVTLTMQGLGASEPGEVESTSPTLNWTYTKLEGDAQQSYRVLIFTQAQVANFDFPTTLTAPNEPNTATQSLVTQYLGLTNNTYWAAQSTYYDYLTYQPVYDSGVINSSGTSFTIPSGILSNYGSYRVFVFASDVGSNGRWSIPSNSGAGGAGQGLDFSCVVEPILMPSLQFSNSPGTPASSFNALTGSFSGMEVQERINLLPQVDADFSMGSALTPSTGAWAVQSTTGPSITDTGTTVAANTVNGINVLQLTPAGASPVVSVMSGPVAVQSGTIITGEFKAWAQDAGLQLGIEFFYNVSGSVQGTYLYTHVLTPKLTTAPGNSTGQAVKLFVQTMAPTVPGGVVYSRLRVLNNNNGAVSGHYIYIYDAGLTINCLNLLDDASFELSSTSNSLFWTGSGGTYGFAVPGYELGSAGTPIAPVSWPLSSQSCFLKSNASIKTSYYLPTQLQTFSGTSSPWLFAVDVLDDTVGSGDNVELTGSNFSSAIVFSPTPTNAWQRLSFPIPNADLTTPQYGNLDIAWETGTGQVELDNAQLEFQWPFVGGTFSSYTSGDIIPAIPVLGWTATTTTPTQAYNGYGGQFWFQIQNPNYTSTQFDNSVTLAGSGNSLLVTAFSQSGGGGGDFGSGDFGTGTFGALGAGVSGTAFTYPSSVDQLFTVSGLTNFTLTWYWVAQGAIGTAQITFYNSACQPVAVQPYNPTTMVTTQVLETITTASNATPPSTGMTPESVNVAVPPTAAYALLSFVSNAYTPGLAGKLWIFDPAMTTSGTYEPSTPWLDGGWSAGYGSANTSSTTSSAQSGTIMLQRSTREFLYSDSEGALNSDGTSSWVRGPGTNGHLSVAAAGASLSSGVFDATFGDYEYPGSPYQQAQNIYYRASIYLPGLGAYTPPSQPIEVSQSFGFVPSGWLLMDPLVPADNVMLNVKTAKFQTDENQTTFMPAGRGRKVVIGDTQIFGDTITLELNTLNNQSYTALQKQVAKVYPLMLRNPDGEFWYVRLTKRSRERVWQGTYASPYRTYSLTMEQVDAVP